MAFNIKKARQAAPEETQVCPNNPNANIVATRSWVWKVLEKFVNWTNLFKTNELEVTGGASASRLTADEVQTNTLYTNKIILVDDQGNPGYIYIDDKGEVKIQYDYKDVFVYPNDDVDTRMFCYKYPEVYKNFENLTPYETLVNFIPFKSTRWTKFNNKVCFKLCEADGKNELVGRTMLFSCRNNLNKISSIKVVDNLGNELQDIPVPEGNYKRFTINMPSFRKNGEDIIVDLPSTGLCPGCQNFPPSETTDIFDDRYPEDDGLFDDVVDGSSMSSLIGGDDVETVYEDYSTSTYFNIALNRDFFEQNKEQFLKVETTEA